MGNLRRHYFLFVSLIGTLVLSSISAWAAESSTCDLKAGYVLRDANGYSLGVMSKGNSEYKCVGPSRLMKYHVSSGTRQSVFSEVRLQNGRTAWVAKSAVEAAPPAVKRAAPSVLETKKAEASPQSVASDPSTQRVSAPVVWATPPSATDSKKAEAGADHQTYGPSEPDKPTAAPVVEASSQPAPDPSTQRVSAPVVWTSPKPASEPEKTAQVYDPVSGLMRDAAPDRPNTAIPPAPLAIASQSAAVAVKAAAKRQWISAKTAMNLRDNPGTNGSQVMGTMSAGGRLEVVEQKAVDGNLWKKVVPFDCDKLSMTVTVEDSCNQAYWVKNSDYNQDQLPTLAELQQRDANTPIEAKVNCDGTCNKSQAKAPAGDKLKSAADQIEAAAAEIVSPLYKAFLEAENDFKKANPLGRRSEQQWALTFRGAFVNFLVRRLGAADASRAIEALTAWGEARGANAGNKWGNMGEMAMVISVINNRSKSGYHDQSEWVKSNDPALEKINVATAFAQFSVWNSNDKNLPQLLRSGADPGLARAFETVELMEQQKIRPIGALAQDDTRHYYTGSRPLWALTGRAVLAQVVVPSDDNPDGTIYTVQAHQVYEGVW